MAEEKSSWYEIGFGGLPKAEAEATKRGIWSFFVPRGESKEVIFLDKDPFCFYEHSIKIGESYGNNFVCLQGISPRCPFCEKDPRSRHYVGYWTVLDLTGFTGKDGKKYRNMRLLFQAKPQVLKKLKLKIENRLGGDISRAKFLISRSDDPKAPRVGDDFEFIEKVPEEKLVDKDGKPLKAFDYKTIFVPLTLEQAISTLEEEMELSDSPEEEIVY